MPSPARPGRPSPHASRAEALLFAPAWTGHVGTDAAGVSQYIRAAPVASGPVLRANLIPAAERRHPGILLQLRQGDKAAVPNYARCARRRRPLDL